MQQVGARQFADAQAVPLSSLASAPPELPALRQPNSLSVSRRALITLNHAWVLHRRVFIRVAGALLALVFIVGLYQAREPLAKVGTNLVNMVQGEFAAAGFGIDAIKISGQTLSQDEHIIALLMMSGGSSTLDFDAQKARNLLRWMQAVQSATVRKIYPGEVGVDIVEKTPVVRWRVGTTTWLVDESGQRIGTDPATAYTDLPLVVGEGAADDAIIMTRMLDRHPLLKNDLAALSRIGDRRWDLIYFTGLRVQLPEQGVAQALEHLEAYQRDSKLLDRDVTLVDLRVPGLVALKPGPLAAEQLAEAAKPGKPKKPTVKVDPATPAEKPAEKVQ
ncbi:MAG: cell division protein FtsQ/DivIB [Devosia sp.]